MIPVVTRDDVLALFERMHRPRSPQDFFLFIDGHEFTSIDAAVKWLRDSMPEDKSKAVSLSIDCDK